MNCTTKQANNTSADAPGGGVPTWEALPGASGYEAWLQYQAGKNPPGVYADQGGEWTPYQYQRKGLPKLQDTRKVKLEAQGHVFKVHTAGEVARLKPGKRNQIEGFSAGSRKRLLEKAGRLEPKDCSFLTLTYPEKYPPTRITKKHLNHFLIRLERAFPLLAVLWRLEFQKRGAPHYHLMLYNVPYIPKEKIQAMWGKIIGFKYPFTRIERCRSHKKMMNYVSKYIAKKEDAEGHEEAGSAGFNNETYLNKEKNTPGRFWGIRREASLPYAEKTIVEDLPISCLNDLKRSARGYLRSKWREMKKEHPESKRGPLKIRGQGGFTIFTDDPHAWLTLAAWYESIGMGMGKDKLHEKAAGRLSSD